MKPVGTVSRWISCGVALMALLVVSAAQAAVGKAVVRSVQGTASYSEQGGDWKPLKNGKVLAPGAVVKTGVASYAQLDIGDNGPTITLTPDTTLGLDKLDVDRTGSEAVVETQLDLRQGTIQGIVNKLAAASRYEVKTPNTVFGVRGSERQQYQISADGVSHVIRGSAMVAYTNPVTKRITTHQVNEGQSFVPPVDPAVAGAAPTVRATRAGEVLPVPQVSVTPVTTAVVVPSTEPFVSPVAGERP